MGFRKPLRLRLNYGKPFLMPFKNTKRHTTIIGFNECPMVNYAENWKVISKDTDIKISTN